MTFDYDFYSAVLNALVSVSKGNNPKYIDKGGTALYPFEHYMENLEQLLTAPSEEE